MTAPLRVLPQTLGVDLAAAERAAVAFLAALGVTSPGRHPRPHGQRLRRAAQRRARSTSRRSSGDEGYDELILAREIPVRSVCEHHMLPFVGVAHVGYLPGARILGLSKLARVVELHAHRPQVQERLTTHVADWLHTHLHPRGVGVVIEAEHMCMTLRGVRAAGTTTITSSVRGALRDDPRSRAEFLALTSGGRHG